MKFAGVIYGVVGAVQINFVLPSGLSAGPQKVVVSPGRVVAPPATVTITQ